MLAFGLTWLTAGWDSGQTHGQPGGTGFCFLLLLKHCPHGNAPGWKTRIFMRKKAFKGRWPAGRVPALRPCPAPVVPRVLGGYVPLPRRPPHVASPHVLVGLVVEPLHDGSATRPPPLHRPTSPPSTSGPADFRFRRPRIRGHTLPPHTHPPHFSCACAPRSGMRGRQGALPDRRPAAAHPRGVGAGAAGEVGGGWSVCNVRSQPGGPCRQGSVALSSAWQRPGFQRWPGEAGTCPLLAFPRLTPQPPPPPPPR